jgi:predicted ATPase with chaperone activity
MVSRHQKRIFGPLLDRIDIHIEVSRVEYEKLADDRLGTKSENTNRGFRNINQPRGFLVFRGLCDIIVQRLGR